MAIADRSGLPLAAWIESASPHEVKLVEATLNAMFIDEDPERLIGDKAYDSDKLDAELAERGRWRVERLFAWLHNFRRLVTRYEYHAINFLGFLWLGCIVILLRGL